ncbi:neuron navigator 2 [Trichuris trichiura]|uniref:Neuron navigator 2 n=1 Tax=Trichuris trichiura TaxID=36087 RepID=A0A077Z703_TRITR|nr:neuron navigator 2 [Trichuris trichiura]
MLFWPRLHSSMISGDLRLYFNRNVQIYTDWANQYLEKNQKSRLIRDLQKDLQDSIVLIDIIECVLSSEVPNVRRKPNGRSQAIDNIASCLRYLSSIGVQLDGVTVQGIHDGQLKSILNLFYNLSWFKKEHYRMKKYQGPSKLTALSSEQKQPSRLPTSKASAGHEKLNCNTAVASNMANSNSGPTQVPAIPVPTEKSSSATTPGGVVVASEPGEKVTKVEAAPNKHEHSKLSGIPSYSQRATTPRQPAGATLNRQVPYGPSKLPSGPSSTGSLGYPKTAASGREGKMLDKFGLFGGSCKDKVPERAPMVTRNEYMGKTAKGVARATSNSSSGFSSAKSELSDVCSSVEGSFPCGQTPKSRLKGAASSSDSISTKSAGSGGIQMAKGTRKGVFAGRRPPEVVSSSKEEAERNPECSGPLATPSSSRKNAPTLQKLERSHLPAAEAAHPAKKAQTVSGKIKYQGNNSLRPLDSGRHHPANSVAHIGQVSENTVYRPCPAGGGKPTHSSQGAVRFGIPKPTLAVKGTAKNLTTTVAREDSASKQAHGQEKNHTRIVQVAKSSSNADGSTLGRISDDRKGTPLLRPAGFDRTIGGAQRIKAPEGIPSHSFVKEPVQSGYGPGNVSGGSGGAVVGVVSPISQRRTLSAPSQGNEPSTTIAGDSGEQSDSASSHTSENPSETNSIIYCPPTVEPPPMAKEECRTETHLDNGTAQGGGRTKSRIETTFHCNDGVVITHDISTERKAFELSSFDGGLMVDDEAVSTLKPMEPVLSPTAQVALLHNLLPPGCHGGFPKPNGHKGPTPFPRRESAGDHARTMWTGSKDAVNLTYGCSSDGDPYRLDLPQDQWANQTAGDYDLTLYVRRMQDRFREGIAAAQDVLRKTNPLEDSPVIGDNFMSQRAAYFFADLWETIAKELSNHLEDSTSLSSGASENADEISTDDLTNSSLSDGQPTSNDAKVETSDSTTDSKEEQTAIDQQHQLVSAIPARYGLSPSLKPKTHKARNLHPPTTVVSKAYGGESYSGGSPMFGEYGLVGRPPLHNTVAPVGSRRPQAFSRPTPNAISPKERNAGRTQNPIIGSGMAIGCHSLDRKKQLLAQAETPFRTVSIGDHQQPLYYEKVTSNNKRQDMSSLLSIVSPKRIPYARNGAVVMGGPQLETMSKTAQSTSMSRSMIDELSAVGVTLKSGRAQQNCQSSPGGSSPPAIATSPTSVEATKRAIMDVGYKTPPLPVRNRPSDIAQPLFPHRLGARASNDPTVLCHGTAKSWTAAPLQNSGNSAGGSHCRLVQSSNAYAAANGCENPACHHPQVFSLEEPHGSSLSLSSTTSSLYSSAEDRYQTEIRKLHREVEIYKEKVQTLTTQQSTYAHVVAAFEQSLKSMTKRMQALTAASQQKDFELSGLKQKMEMLRELSIAAGLKVDQLITAPNDSMGQQHRLLCAPISEGRSPLSRQPSSESMISAVSQQSNSSVGKSSSSSTTAKKSKSSWIRSSFNKAFSKAKKNKACSNSDIEEGTIASDRSHSNSPKHRARSSTGGTKYASSSSASPAIDETDIEELVYSLKKQLVEKDSVLTDIRLEALTSAQQVDQLKEALHRLKGEMFTLKENNQRLQSIVTNISHSCSHSSLPPLSDDECSSGKSSTTGTSTSSRSLQECMRIRVAVAVEAKCGAFSKESREAYIFIGCCHISGKTKWDRCDSLVAKVFREYLLRVDPIANLGLNADSILQFDIGDFTLTGNCPPADCTPYMFVSKPKNRTVVIRLRGPEQNAFDSLAFETMIPKSVVQRYATILLDQRRVILSCPVPMNLNDLALSLAEYCVTRVDPSRGRSAIAILNGKSGGCKGRSSDLTQMIRHEIKSSICGNPLVLILQNWAETEDQLSELLCALAQSQAISNTYVIVVANRLVAKKASADAQLHQEFRYVLSMDQGEASRDRLFKVLRRRLIDGEVRRQGKLPSELAKVFDWLPKIWSYLYKYFEAFAPGGMPLSPDLFVDCPLDKQESRQWFVDLWNKVILPELAKTVPKACERQARCQDWPEPSSFIVDSWPWTDGPNAVELLRTLPYAKAGGARRVNRDDKDPLSTLIRLQQNSRADARMDYRTNNLANFAPGATSDSI